MREPRAGRERARPASDQRPVEEGRPPPSPAGRGREAPPVEEIGGPKGPEPTRYGDWEKGGRCTDF